MASHPAAPPPYTHHRPVETDSGAFFKVAAMLLGLAVAVVGFFALMMWADARDTRHPAPTTAVASGDDVAGIAGIAGTDAQANATAAGLESYAGAAPANADALAAAHKSFPATLPAAAAGPVVNVNLALTDRTIEVAPGIK